MSCSFQVSQQHFDQLGVPLDGAQLYCYTGTSTNLHNTYSDQSMTILNTNPIILNGRGDCDVYWDGSSVRFELYSDGALVKRWDDVREESGGASTAYVDTKVAAEAALRTAADTTLSTNVTAIGTDLIDHLGDTSNPHSVTAAQVGACTISQVTNITDAIITNVNKCVKFETQSLTSAQKEIARENIGVPETVSNFAHAAQKAYTVTSSDIDAAGNAQISLPVFDMYRVGATNGFGVATFTVSAYGSQARNLNCSIREIYEVGTSDYEHGNIGLVVVPAVAPPWNASASFVHLFRVTPSALITGLRLDIYGPIPAGITVVAKMSFMFNGTL